MRYLRLSAACVWLSAAFSAADFSIVEANIQDLQALLTIGQINSVQLVAKHLHRVAQYDRRGPRLNAIPVFNPDIFAHAQASDQYRADHSHARSPLEGIPGTIKDSYMMAGLTVASGSPAFVNLTASENAFTTGRIRDAGGLILGKTNMPPMANGGMQRGVYGRAESPYNKEYLTAAYASGSSNGAGTSTAASMGVFAMAEETVSSGRSPASNNGLVAYTPSRGVLSIRGNWPLFPVADVVVPYARTVSDLFAILDVILVDDENTEGDFWRGQPFVELPLASAMRPEASFTSLEHATALSGLRLGVPKMYIGEDDPDAQPVWVSSQVRQLWDEARKTLESLGAEVVEVGFPLVTNSEGPGEAASDTEYPLPGRKASNSPPQPGDLPAYSWDNFLHMVNDTKVSGLDALEEVDPALIFPQLPGTLPDRYGNRFGNRTEANTGTVDSIRGRKGGIYELPGLEEHLVNVEQRRKTDLEDWMDENSLDALVWPSVGDVGREDAETNDTSAVHAWRTGVFFSNGNYAIRQYGVPTVSVSMGLMSDIRMPVDLTSASKAYDDKALLSYSYAFEQAHEKRVAPPRTPELPTDLIPLRCAKPPQQGTEPPHLCVEVEKHGNQTVQLSGKIASYNSGGLQSLQVYLDGVDVGPITVDEAGGWTAEAKVKPFDEVSGGDVPVRFVNEPDLSLSMVVVVATARNGRSDGKLLWI